MRVGRPKCGAFVCLSLFWAAGALILLSWLKDYEKPEQMVKIFTEPTFWSMAAVSPSFLFALLACIFRLREKPKQYVVNVPAGADPQKLY